MIDLITGLLANTKSALAGLVASVSKNTLQHHLTSQGVTACVPAAPPSMAPACGLLAVIHQVTMQCQGGSMVLFSSSI